MQESVQKVFMEWMMRQLFKKHFQKRKLSSPKTVILEKLFSQKKVKFYSIIFLKPVHHLSDFHIPTLKAILKHLDKIKEATLIIGVRKNDDIKLRIRFFNPKSQI
jgi:hypothetical protein